MILGSFNLLRITYFYINVRRLVGIVLLLFVSASSAKAQDCNNPVQLCYNNPIDTISTENMTAGPSAFCFDTNNSAFFSVTTNSNGGYLNISINSFNCLDTLPNGDNLFMGLEAALYEADENNLCDASMYNILDCSTPSTEEVILEFNGLQPETTYYVMVDGGVDASNSLGAGICDFNIDVTGAAIENSFTAGPDFTIDFGESTTLQPSGYGDMLSWSPLTGLLNDNTEPNVSVAPTNDTDYTLTTLLDGCLVTDTVTVTVLPTIYPYNAFTPNEDGFNDVWLISLIDRYPKADIKVFSRWGQVVFRSIGYNTPWDGRINGNLLPAATYYYIIQLNDNRLEEEKNLYAGVVAIVY